MSMKKKSARLGSSFSDYLKGEGSYDETSTVAAKRVLAWQLEEAIREAGKFSSTPSSKPRTSWGVT